MTENKFFSLRLFAFLLLCSFACTSTKTPIAKDTILATLGDKLVYLSEFQYVYEKSVSNKDSLYEETSVRDYLNLFLDFKLKVVDAQNLGIDTTTEFIKEFATYEEQLAKPYLTDPSAIDTLVKEAYNRMKEEINVSHILIQVAEEAEPQDTLAAYQKISEIREKALKSESIESLALTHSQDPNVSQNKGNLGYFTAMQMVYPFEDAAYKTPLNGISSIVRTKYGYHLLQVKDRRPNSGKVSVAHIMIRASQKSSLADSLAAKKKIDEIYQRLQKGENWEKLCTEFSQDASSVENGGKLPEFSVGTVIPAFEKAAFELNNINDISKPVLSPFGWHIIKLLDKRGVPPFKEIEATLKQEINKDSRAVISQNVMVNKLKKENNFTEYPDVWQEILPKADVKLLKGNWSYNSMEQPGLDKTLFSFKNKSLKKEKSITVRNFFDYVYLKQVAKPEFKEPKHYFRLLYHKFTEESTIQFERSNLKAKYKEYKMLVNEYHEGMMLFQMMTDKVWNKAIVDTAGCRNYFNQNRADYRWDLRANAVVYKAKNEETFNQLKPYLNKNLYPVYALKANNLYFDKDESILDEASLNTLGELINILKDEPSLSIEIAGHADPAEKATMAQERLDPVVKYLTFKQINISRIITKNYGFTKPVSKTDRSKNRRIEFLIFSSSKKELEKIINTISPNSLSISEGVFQKGDNIFLDKVTWTPGNNTLRENGQVIYIEINDVKEPRLKEFDEARGYVITDYQKHLEKDWLTALKAKYPIKINEQEVKKIIKK